MASERLLIGLVLSPLFMALPAFAAEKVATCVLNPKSILGRSASGVAQVGNLGSIEIECGILARPVPSRPGESRPGLVATAIAHPSPEGAASESFPAELNVTGGRSDGVRDYVVFYAHIPLDPADLDIEARRYLAKMEAKMVEAKMLPPELQTAEGQQRAVKNLRELVYQHRAGHFRIVCSVLEGDHVMGVGEVELEVIFQGRFSDAGLPGAPPA